MLPMTRARKLPGFAATQCSEGRGEGGSYPLQYCRRGTFARAPGTSIIVEGAGLRRSSSIPSRHMPLKRLGWTCASVLGTLAISISCMRATASAEGTPLIPTSVATPTLVVFIAVDQLRGDMLDRHRSQLNAGYARLMRGAWFVNGFQDHAITETAPGHASTMSGRFPASTGIMSNSAGVVDPNYRLITGSPSEAAASPMRFQGTTLFDWLTAKDPRARALSVSMKDRSAILMIGRSKQEVYWYSPIGAFTTSTYYRDTLPGWVTAFNARRIPHRYAGAEWRLLRDSSQYAEPDSVP